MDKSFYDRKVIYLDYLERGEKVKNGGVIKWEVRDGKCRMQIHVRGLYTTDTFEGEIRFIAHGQFFVAEHIRLKFGTGEALLCYDSEDLAKTGISCMDLDAIEIYLSETRKLVGKIREVKAATPKPETDESPKTETDESPEPETDEQPKTQEPKEPETVSEEPPKEVTYLSTDKWTQLTRYYKKINPFEDDRNYLSITPRDFVVLQKDYQKLVQNSFLLHGYYNYGHVILTKIEGEEENYYIGVPGVYYEKEKQAAILFGFEGFEGETEEHKDGSFGYYMKRVEI